MLIDTPIKLDALNAADLSIVVQKNPLSGRTPKPLASLLLRGRCAQLIRPIRPGQFFIFFFWRARADVDLVNFSSTLASGNAHTIAARIASADNGNIAPLGRHRSLPKLSGKHLVFPLQKLQCKMCSLALAPFNGEISRHFCPTGKHYSIKISAQLIGFDLAKPAVRLAAKLVPQALFAVGGSFCAPVADGWADVLLNVFSPFAAAEFARMLRPGGVLIYAVPTPRHLYGLKEILYDRPYENPDQNTDYPGFVRLPDRERTVTAALTLDAAAAQQLFMMTPYCYNTPAAGAARLAAQQTLGTEIGFRFLVYRREPGA